MNPVVIETHTRNLANALIAALAAEVADRIAAAGGRNARIRRQRENRVRSETRIVSVTRNWRQGSYVAHFSPRIEF